tara:strand:+ start:1302 stop:1634 length:333 start_codon:yes stop_codon:yes gene_type:complete
MNHSQKLNSIKDEIKALIKDKKGSSPLEIKESIKNTFDVSYRTADRYYKTFKEPDHYSCLEVSENKKELSSMLSRSLKNDLEDIEGIEDIEKRLEYKKLFSKILNDISTY